MTEQEQFKACAELDGWSEQENEEVEFCYPGGYQNVRRKRWHHNWTGSLGDFLSHGVELSELPNYCTYDAIIPLRIKVINTIELRVKWLNHARKIVGRRMPKNKSGTPLVSDFDIACIQPQEDRESVLRATGKWKD